MMRLSPHGTARRAALATTLAAAALVPASASAATAVAPAPRLWATVNICDTASHPNAIGIRGSMPGRGDRAERMFMRFQVQYYSRADRLWHDVRANGDSGFIDVGSSAYRTRQAGRTFTVAAPAGATLAYRLRGMVTFEWRKDGEVVKRLRRRTTGKHPGTRGSDPVGYSAGSCVVS